jgi:hypothetical protein
MPAPPQWTDIAGAELPGRILAAPRPPPRSAPASNTHSARCPAGALPATSCLALFWSPPASACGQSVIPATKNLHSSEHSVGPQCWRGRLDAGSYSARTSFQQIGTRAVSAPVRLARPFPDRHPLRGRIDVGGRAGHAGRGGIVNWSGPKAALGCRADQTEHLRRPLLEAS